MSRRVDPAPSEPSIKTNPITILIAVAGIILSLTIGLLVTGVSNTKYVLLVVVGLVAFIFTFLRLDLGVIAMIFILYSQMYLILGERYGLTDVVQYLIMLLVVCMGTRWLFYTAEFPKNWMRPFFLVFFYCIVCLASVLYAVDPLVATPVVIETLKSGTIALIIAVVLKNKDSLRLAIWTLLIVGIFLGTLSVIQFALGTYTNDYGGYALATLSNISGQTNDYRIGGPTGDPNYYAQMMLVLVPMALDRLWSERQAVLRILAAWALGVCTLTVLLTYSRGGFIALMVVIIASLVTFYRGQIRYVLAVAVVGLLVINVLPSQFKDRISTLAQILPGFTNTTGSVDSSIRGRTSEMIVAVQMFADHPLLGVGVGNYPPLYQKYAQKLGMEFRSEIRQAHDLYLEVASETGLLGLFSFLLMLWGISKSIWDAQRSLAKKGLTSLSHMVAAYGFGFLGYLVAALFIHNAYPRIFWVIVGVALSIPQVARAEIESTEAMTGALLQDGRA